MTRNVDGIAVKQTMLAFALFVLLTRSAAAGVTSPEEGASLRSDIAAMFTSFEQGDAEAFVNAMHPSLHELARGREAFELATRAALAQLRRSGLRFLSAVVGEPTRT